MIKLGVDEYGSVLTAHFITPPMVYLDHWGLMTVAEEHCERFATALQRRGGTLALSWVNFIEMSAVSGKTASPLVSLLRRVRPQIAFIDVEAGSVVAKENEVLAGRRRGAAILHDEWLKVYFGVHRKRSLDPLDPAEFVELLRSSKARRSLRKSLDHGRIETTRLIGGARTRRGEPTIRKRLFAPPPKVRASRVPPTRFAFAEGLKYLVKNDLNLESGNHLQDFWHTIVPISYADYVLLDKNWKEAAEQIQKTLRRRGLLTHEAAVYSDVDEFLFHLEVEETYRGFSSN